MEITAALLFASFSAFLGAGCFGWNLGVINNPKTSIEHFINVSVQERYQQSLDSYGLDFLWGVVVSIFAVGGMVGALVSGVWADKLGRKRGMLVNCAFGLVSALLMALSKAASSIEMLIAGRLLVGFCSALYTGLVPVYLTELAPRQLRGSIGVLNHLGIVIGILLSQVLSLGQLLGNDTLWPVLLGLSGLPSLLQLACLPWCPESPRYLLIARSDEAAARQSLSRLRGHSLVDDEVSEMRSEAESAGQVKSASVLQLGRQWRPLLVGVVLHLSQQLSGINFILYYSSELFKAVGASESAARYATVGVGVIMIIMTVVSIPLMETAGRRTLHLIGLLGISVCSAIFTLLYTLGSSADSNSVPAGYAWSSVAFALLVVVFYTVGPGSIPWTMMSEMFAQEWRAPANAVGVLVNWLFAFVVGILFSVLLNALGPLVFVPFTVLTVVFLVFLFFKMPETKGKTVEEVTRVFQNRNVVTPMKDDKEAT